MSPLVVPANAGTHNHRLWLLNESRRTASHNTCDTAYGPLRLCAIAHQAGTTVCPVPLPSVILIRPHRPSPLLVAGGVGAVGLGRVAVDQRAHEHRVRGAAHLVLDGEQVPAAIEIDDVAKAVLILVVLLRDQAALPQAM